MKAIWSYRATKALHVLETYILKEFGELKRQEYMLQAEKTAYRLEEFPGMGRLEPLLKHRKNPYRSVLMTPKTKLIYYIDESRERIVISDCWDTRREPKTVAKGL